MDRQTTIETNRSLRLIKNELETLIEKGVLNDDAYSTIMNLLPAESPLSGAPPAKAKSATPAPTEYKSEKTAPPPAYSQTGPPALPIRTNTAPPAPPSKPVLASARALYDYTGADERDVSFQKDDRIAIHEYMNADWWMGKNLRTGQEGIFPKNYVQVDEEKAMVPGPGAPMNPYNSHAPPMAMASSSGGHQGEPSKMEQHGKKFGKKLGNAAVFGAGATIGSKIVNGIF